MAVANLRNDPTGIITGNDNIVIVNHFDGIRGGRTLDVTGFTQKIINAGHVIIKDGDNVLVKASHGMNFPQIVHALEEL